VPEPKLIRQRDISLPCGVCTPRSLLHVLPGDACWSWVELTIVAFTCFDVLVTDLERLKLYPRWRGWAASIPIIWSISFFPDPASWLRLYRLDSWLKFLVVVTLLSTLELPEQVLNLFAFTKLLSCMHWPIIALYWSIWPFVWVGQSMVEECSCRGYISRTGLAKYVGWKVRLKTMWLKKIRRTCSRIFNCSLRLLSMHQLHLNQARKSLTLFSRWKWLSHGKWLSVSHDGSCYYNPLSPWVLLGVLLLQKILVRDDFCWQKPCQWVLSCYPINWTLTL